MLVQPPRRESHRLPMQDPHLPHPHHHQHDLRIHMAFHEHHVAILISVILNNHSPIHTSTTMACFLTLVSASRRNLKYHQNAPASASNEHYDTTRNDLELSHPRHLFGFFIHTRDQSSDLPVLWAPRKRPRPSLSSISRSRPVVRALLTATAGASIVHRSAYLLYFVSLPAPSERRVRPARDINKTVCRRPNLYAQPTER
jgi:hypothetical protein